MDRATLKWSLNEDADKLRKAIIEIPIRGPDNTGQLRRLERIAISSSDEDDITRSVEKIAEARNFKKIATG